MMNAFLDECNKKVNVIESVMEELRQKHTRMLEQVASYGKVVSAVRRLPGDVLGEIASALVDDAGAILPPWKTSAVCASWRFALIRYPWLWATIKPGNLEKVKLQLERTGNAPLRVWVTHDEDLHVYLELLLPHCRRWRLLCVGEIRGWGINKEALHLLEAARGKLDWLVDLRLVHCDLPPRLEKLFLVTPALRTMHLFGFWGTSLQVPCSQITRFSVDQMNPQTSDPLRLLRSMPSLAQCVLGTFWSSIPVHSQPGWANRPPQPPNCRQLPPNCTAAHQTKCRPSTPVTHRSQTAAHQPHEQTAAHR
ncbi:hypothetical protein C8F01DRAFT_1225817 [Mycena amicta]|nr:hypothetical protein C8F01DRAFT_1225817 [Mycena amicta]